MRLSRVDHVLLSVSTLGDAGLSTAGSASLAGNARPVSRMQGFPMMSCARVPILSMCYISSGGGGSSGPAPRLLY